MIKENTDIAENDELLTFLQLSSVDEDEYLRYRISERFNMLMVSLFEAHKKDKLPPEQAEAIADMKEAVETFLDTRKTEEANKAKAIVFWQGVWAEYRQANPRRKGSADEGAGEL